MVSESTAIAKYLDATYPDTPQLVPEGTVALQKLASDFVLWNVHIPLVTNTRLELLRLGARSQEHLERGLLQVFGRTAEELYSEDNWVKLEQGLGKLAAFLDANGAGKDVLFAGDRVSFVDFELAGLLIFARVIYGKEGDVWKRICGWNGGRWERFLDQFESCITWD